MLEAPNYPEVFFLLSFKVFNIKKKKKNVVWSPRYRSYTKWVHQNADAYMQWKGVSAQAQASLDSEDADEVS